MASYQGNVIIANCFPYAFEYTYQERQVEYVRLVSYYQTTPTTPPSLKGVRLLTSTFLG